MNRRQIYLLIVITGFVLTLLAKGDALMWRAIALGGLMIFFWLVEALPIYVTALLPIALGRPLGVVTPGLLGASYANKFVFLFLGGFILALVMEKWDVHKQVARSIIGLVGSSKRRVLLGFIISTGLLSMWISNTATTLMMLPMATAVTANVSRESNSKFPVFLLLSIAYASSIGGMATLVGSPPNTTMAGILGDYNIDVSFWDWMKFGLPLSVIMLTALFMFFSFRLRREPKGDHIEVDIEKRPWNSSQIQVMLIFGGVVLLWVFRKLIIEYTGITYGDENVAMLAAIIMFIISGRDGTKLLVWEDMSKLPWGILLLFGGGFALAKMLEVNGVIDELVQLFNNLSSIHILVLLLISVAIAIFGTEVMSNTALVSVFIPILAKFGDINGLPILTLCLPVALAASCAFMLPIGTPPNAIVFSSSDLTIRQMAKTGFVLNFIGMMIIVTFTMLFIR